MSGWWRAWPFLIKFGIIWHFRLWLSIYLMKKILKYKVNATVLQKTKNKQKNGPLPGYGSHLTVSGPLPTIHTFFKRLYFASLESCDDRHGPEGLGFVKMQTHIKLRRRSHEAPLISSCADAITETPRCWHLQFFCIENKKQQQKCGDICSGPKKSQVCWNAGFPFPLLPGSANWILGLRRLRMWLACCLNAAGSPSERFNIAYCQIRLQNVNPLSSPLSFAEQPDAILESESINAEAILKKKKETHQLLES